MTDAPRPTSACASHPDLARAVYRQEATLTMLGSEVREGFRLQAAESKEMRADSRETLHRIEAVAETTGKLDKLLVEHLAEHRGRELGAADVTGEHEAQAGRAQAATSNRAAWVGVGLSVLTAVVLAVLWLSESRGPSSADVAGEVLRALRADRAGAVAPGPGPVAGTGG